MWENWTRMAREALGLERREKLPAGALGPVEIPGGRTRLARLDTQEPLFVDSRGRPRRRMKHRLHITCNFCGCWIPAGRLRQHERACPQRDN